MTSKIQDNLNKYCLINRKYQILNDTEFYSKFSNIKIEFLKTAWDYGLNEIQNDEIIKNAVELPKQGKKEIEKKLRKFNFSGSELFYFLNSKFEVNELKLDDGQIERRLRNILAIRHQKNLNSEIKKLNRKERLNEIKDKILSGILTSIIPLIIIGIIFGSKIRDGFTSIDVLTERIYEREIYEFNGSICRDGNISHSQGRGTCSWHHGVQYEFYKGQHKKTRSECRIEAKEISWIE